MADIQLNKSESDKEIKNRSPDIQKTTGSFNNPPSKFTMGA